MALSGIQIYKLLPQTNCKECSFPTCLAFAMKLAAKQVELSACPYVSEESKKQLAESAAPPIRLISLRANGTELKVGNEVVMFRHEKTFYNKPGLFLRVKASDPDLAKKVAAADAYKVNYVGMDFSIDGFAIELDGNPEAAKTVRSVTKRPLILIGNDAAALDSTLSLLAGESTLIYAADSSNHESLADVATKHKAILAVKADSLEALADLTQKVQARGVEDMVLDLGGKDLGEWLTRSTQARRLALKSNFKPLGYPTIFFAAQNGLDKEAVYASQAITKYAGFVVIDTFAPEMIYPLLVLRENIYTDPQKPIQVQPGIYEINSPKSDSPVLVTTNFSITYFAVANEVEGSGLPAWLVVTDAEGMSVLTAWAAGKFDAERIAKAIKGFNVEEKVSKKRIVLPGHVAVLSGEVEEELPGWEVRVGPREAVDLPAFMKQVLN
ncbi:MAG: acetyl-CoA decarbonylase/synthase complex subunit gamma [Chloroflexi bacterium]|nr:MAG: acetyl-CoA decarbonylase/synthase complex subunit gamma [Chloroflexota bacterium]MCE7858955.1 acetyl-CoA decarbonylase/synthase complex subunit gamma [Chloroflexi bacterium CFX2]